MTKQSACRQLLSRRTMLAAGAGFAGTAAAGSPDRIGAAGPLSTAERQAGDPAERHNQSAAGLAAGATRRFIPIPMSSSLDPSFTQLALGNAGMHRLWTGAFWAEGPAWSSQGQYLVFSDVQGNTQYRYIWDDGRVTPFRRPSYNSNGNSFDYQGRQLVDPGFLPPRRALGTRRHDDRDRRFLRGQAAELAQRSGAASRRQHLVHRSRLWRSAAGRPSRRGRRSDQPARAAEPARRRRKRRRHRRPQARIADQRLSLGPERLA